MPPKKVEITKEVRLASIKVLVTVDVLENGKKVAEGVYGPSEDGEQSGPYVFFNIEQLSTFTKTLPDRLAASNEQLGPVG